MTPAASSRWYHRTSSAFATRAGTVDRVALVVVELDRARATVDRAHITASRLAAALMLPQRSGLIVSTTANLASLPYMPNLFYDLAKNAIARLVWAMAQEP